MMKDGAEAKAEDSDYYTPEDPHTNILSPVKSERPIEKVNCTIFGRSCNVAKHFVNRRTLRLRCQLLKTLNSQTALFLVILKFLQGALRATVPAHLPDSFYLPFPLIRVKLVAKAKTRSKAESFLEVQKI